MMETKHKNKSFLLKKLLPLEVRGSKEEEENAGDIAERGAVEKSEIGPADEKKGTERKQSEERQLLSRAKSSREMTKRHSIVKLSSTHSSFTNFSELMEHPHEFGATVDEY